MDLIPTVIAVAITVLANVATISWWASRITTRLDVLEREIERIRARIPT